MTIDNSVSNEFCSTFVDSINVFDCCLSGVIMINDLTNSLDHMETGGQGLEFHPTYFI